MSDQRERAEGLIESQPHHPNHSLPRLRPSPSEGEGGEANARKPSDVEGTGATANGMTEAKRPEGSGVTFDFAGVTGTARPPTSGEEGRNE